MTNALRCLVNVEVQTWDRDFVQRGGIWVPGDAIRLSTQRRHNLVVTAGLNMIRDFLSNAASTRITHVALGTGTTAAAATDTALQTEVYRDLVTLFTPSAAALNIQLYVSTAQANGSTLAEAGLLSASSSGTLYARSLFASTIAKTSAIAITVSWDLSWSV